jgi:hypothetical protein
MRHAKTDLGDQAPDQASSYRAGPLFLLLRINGRTFTHKRSRSSY